MGVNRPLRACVDDKLEVKVAVCGEYGVYSQETGYSLFIPVEKQATACFWRLNTHSYKGRLHGICLKCPIKHRHGARDH